MGDKKLITFSLADIIKKRIHFVETQAIYDRIYYKDADEGSFLALHEMLEDVEEMHEEEFLNKYVLMLEKSFNQIAEEQMDDDEPSMKLSGYTQAIFEILEYIRPEYRYTVFPRFFK
ncbi:hypothetical protein [Exiguobacterium alkaliphilum]|uniref:hypothetical protein n=1 Tax=Exiguobacterium alkaliphilum TaxID=1428684 RepID=UPI00403A93B9